MEKIRLAFICSFTNTEIRNLQTKKSYLLENFFRRICGKKEIQLFDKAAWVPLFLQAFENSSDFEVHVIAPFKYAKNKYEIINLRNITYHCVKDSVGSVFRYIKNFSKEYRMDPHRQARTRILKVVETVSPDIICLCGAENLPYSPVVNSIKDIPVFVLMQTFLNDPKRIASNIGNTTRRACEMAVLKRANYIGYSESNLDLVKQINPDATIFKVGFPTQKPQAVERELIYDFVFYAVKLSSNKGIEDALNAYSIVAKKYPETKLCIIGDCDSEYKRILDKIIEENQISENVIFKGLQNSAQDVYNIVSESRICLLPGITSFNSTVREAMFMNKPVVAYKIDGVECMMRNGEYIYVAENQNLAQLADRMLYAYENINESLKMAARANEFAQLHYSSRTASQKLVDMIRMAYNNYYHHISIPKEMQ